MRLFRGTIDALANAVESDSDPLEAIDTSSRKCLERLECRFGDMAARPLSGPNRSSTVAKRKWMLGHDHLCDACGCHIPPVLMNDHAGSRS